MQMFAVQWEIGLDYREKFSPVVRYASIRYLISIAVQFNLEIAQIDAVTAFPPDDLKEEVYIYMNQPDEAVGSILYLSQGSRPEISYW